MTALWLVITVAGVAWLLLVGLPFKRTYVDLMSKVDVVYSVRPLDQLASVQVAEVLDGWRCRHEDTNRVTAACSLMGLEPSVRNWVGLFNAPVQKFSWLNIRGAHKAGLFGVIKMGLLASSDNAFYVSPDWTIAIFRNDETGGVYVFQDQTNVVRFALYSQR